jgi:GNAT superfamily N-acetyltransferase
MTRVTEMHRATTDDVEAIAAVARALGNENVGLPKDFGADRIREWVLRLGDVGTVIVAYDGSIPIGFGTLDITTMEPETGLLGVWVLPDHRRKGLATDLAEAILEFAREHGYRRIRGRLPDGNEPALSFLSSIGAMVPLRNPDMTFELPL